MGGVQPVQAKSVSGTINCLSVAACPLFRALLLCAYEVLRIPCEVGLVWQPTPCRAVHSAERKRWGHSVAFASEISPGAVPLIRLAGTSGH